MHRRDVLSSLIAMGAGSMGFSAWAASFTSGEASQALKTALERGAKAAVAQLGKENGFLNDPKVRIALPGFLEDAAPVLKTLGKGKDIDELITGMNRAAEQAVPMALPLLQSAIKSMTVTDAERIITGGDTSVTQFFSDKTRPTLSRKFQPSVAKVTSKLALIKPYNELAGKAAKMGLVKGDEANVAQYVTGKALDGLFLVIGEQERLIRKDPLGTGSDLLKKVFGSL